MNKALAKALSITAATSALVAGSIQTYISLNDHNSKPKKLTPGLGPTGLPLQCVNTSDASYNGFEPIVTLMLPGALVTDFTLDYTIPQYPVLDLSSNYNVNLTFYWPAISNTQILQPVIETYPAAYNSATTTPPFGFYSQPYSSTPDGGVGVYSTLPDGASYDIYGGTLEYPNAYIINAGLPISDSGVTFSNYNIYCCTNRYYSNKAYRFSYAPGDIVRLNIRLDTNKPYSFEAGTSYWISSMKRNPPTDGASYTYEDTLEAYDTTGLINMNIITLFASEPHWGQPRSCAQLPRSGMTVNVISVYYTQTGTQPWLALQPNQISQYLSFGCPPFAYGNGAVQNPYTCAYDAGIDGSTFWVTWDYTADY